MFARTMWTHLEAVHAVTYFDPDSIAAARTAGLRGFWMGYFGFRVAPMGAVSPGVVEAVFSNFEPSMVRRSIPDAWSFADPADLVRVRARAAGSILRRVSPHVEQVADRLHEDLSAVVAAASPAARPLFAANRDIDGFEDPVELLWQLCTTLREHRGDGHVSTLAVAGVDGCESHLLAAASRRWEPAVFFDHRGWTVEQQNRARDRLVGRRLLDETGLTSSGVALVADIESTTDRLAAEPFDQVLGPDRRRIVLEGLSKLSSDVVGSDVIPFPNPMGLSEPTMHTS